MAAATVNFWFEYVSPYSMISALRLYRAMTKGQHGTAGSSAATSSLEGLASCQVPDLSGVKVVFKPIFLGALFKAAGQPALPNMAVPIKGKYLFHDVKRSLDQLGHAGFPDSKPANWPPNSALAGRLTWMLTQGKKYMEMLDSGDKDIARRGGGGAAGLGEAETRVVAGFVWRVFEAEFTGNLDISNGEVLSKLWDKYVVEPSRSSGEEGGSGVPDGQRAVELAQGAEVVAGFKSSTQEAAELGLFGAPSFTTEDGDMYWGNDRLFEALAHSKSEAKSLGFSVKIREASL
ncbi:hypothetical protein GGI04_001175 [Coemansia thaxteri]|uniref:DSBA-like thioredoxin domain-containing protein n=1 Tax=Coemansia thaxteri TaxID=2663907 RepID=A0A9W8BKT8_9FUNG|nr:hypothetical protein H4R26_001407 [Coemansia thaxteri]KAJ2008361.1 hypothetical protein GGI04_001175 [Coemansia thaxteri]KAJ2473191.1 hypothetical protein GGI02_001054 [Coemansia sp. RSA 2322]